MNQPLISTEEFDAPTESMQSSASAPSAPPAYNDEFKPPIHNPPPYNSQMTEQSVQMAQPPSYPTQSPYAQAYGHNVMNPDQYPKQPMMNPSYYPQQPMMNPQHGMYHHPPPQQPNIIINNTTPVVMQQPPVQQQQTVIIEQPRRAAHLKLGPNSCSTRCQNCYTDIYTSVRTNYQCSSHLWCLGLFLIGAWPFCVVPYCFNCNEHCCKITHSCPTCKAVLGSYETC